MLKKISVLNMGDAGSNLYPHYVADHDSELVGTTSFSEAEEMLLRLKKEVVLLFPWGLTESGSSKVYANEGKHLTPDLFVAMLYEWRKYRMTGNADSISKVHGAEEFMRYATSGPTAFSYVNREEAEQFIARYGNKPTYVSTRGVMYCKIHGNDCVLYGIIDAANNPQPVEQFLRIMIGMKTRIERSEFPELFENVPATVRYVNISVEKGYELAVEAIGNESEVVKTFKLKTKAAGRMFTHYDALEELAKLMV